MIKKWTTPPENTSQVKQLARELRISEVTARMLLNRGLSDPQRARRFLEPSLRELQDPCRDPALAAAASFLCDAVRTGKRIAVFGDYDADGVCATALLVSCLRRMGADVTFHIPQRVEDGYGLNCDALERLKADGADVVVTVDCGISAHREAQHAAKLGLALVVTDHHELIGEAPPADFVLNPRLPGSSFGYEHLAGVGVAFKLAWALGRAYSGSPSVNDDHKAFLLNALSLVAIGTIADLVPLVDENRVLACYGLRALPHSTSPGLQALMQVAGVAAKELSAYHVAFQIAPRLNAAGRLGDASAAVEMLLTDDPRHAADLAAHHEKQNRLRQALQRTIVEEAKARVLSSMDLDRHPCIVLSNPDWHPGVAGLVASKLADTFWRPTFIFCEENGTARGSARSVPGFPLLEAVRRCEDLLERYGGHAGAAGLTLRVENLEPFTERINAVAREMIGAEQPQPLLELEGELRLEELSPAVVDEMRHLAPFGTGNPEPLFMARELRLAGNPQIVGSGQDHLCFLVRQGDVALRAIAFGRAGWLKELAARRGDAFSLAFKPSLNTYNAHTAVELRAEDLQWTSAELVERRPAG